MSNPPLFAGGYYHIYNRGVEKRKIFKGRRDYLRFLEALDYYRKSPLPAKLSDFRRGKIGLKEIDKQVELVRIYCYCLMPHHYHLLVEQLTESGLTVLLRKLSDSYTRYFNTKYERVGPLFQGRFKAKLIDNEEYLLHLSKYIHKNSFPLTKWERKLSVWEGGIYSYSSYAYYLSGEQHPFCDTSLILSYFSKTNPKLSYKDFMEEGDLDDPMLYGLYIDPED